MEPAGSPGPEGEPNKSDLKARFSKLRKRMVDTNLLLELFEESEAEVARLNTTLQQEQARCAGLTRQLSEANLSLEARQGADTRREMDELAGENARMKRELTGAAARHKASGKRIEELQLKLVGLERARAGERLRHEEEGRRGRQELERCRAELERCRAAALAEKREREREPAPEPVPAPVPAAEPAAEFKAQQEEMARRLAELEQKMLNVEKSEPKKKKKDKRQRADREDERSSRKSPKLRHQPEHSELPAFAQPVLSAALAPRSESTSVPIVATVLPKASSTAPAAASPVAEHSAKPAPELLFRPARPRWCELWQLRQSIEAGAGLTVSAVRPSWWRPLDFFGWLAEHVAGAWRPLSASQIDGRLDPAGVASLVQLAGVVQRTCRHWAGVGRVSLLEMLALYLSDSVAERIGRAELGELVGLTLLAGACCQLLGVSGVRMAQVLLHQLLVRCHRAKNQLEPAAQALPLALALCCPMAFGGVDAAGESHSTLLSSVVEAVLSRGPTAQRLAAALKWPTSAATDLGSDQAIAECIGRTLKMPGDTKQVVANRFCATRSCELMAAFRGAEWAMKHIVEEQVWPMMSPEAQSPHLRGAVRIMGVVGEQACNEQADAVASKIKETLVLTLETPAELQRLPLMAEVAAVESILEMDTEDPALCKRVLRWYDSLEPEQRSSLPNRLVLNLDLTASLHDDADS